ncbi:deoxyribodipyrimidine photolyase-related protein [Devosia enhydra]|uniref:Deoxyribodipyrimidine photolyase-related protein n=1 Tax=Devosia enhydra TaxID=665118 RepID=A0A1K2I2H4_9HYPH|nr:cryptochrome/photolyase family protein [Devosia enhydra]SFZ86581.1 deoxyribodipyrimidine photolyase-related protein [Devosia enhydra]
MGTGTLRLILGDQLTRSIASLSGIDADKDVVLMVEVMAEATYVPHHKQKIAFLFSAMRHFAEVLRSEGIKVDYVRLDDEDNSQSFDGELRRAVARHAPEQVVVTEPGEWRVWQMMQEWTETLPVPLAIRADDRFFCSRGAFARWADGRRQFRMEFFYRDMRRQTGLLMEGANPVGGQWNFDHDNRRRLPADIDVPALPRFSPDAVTREVIALVGDRFGDHFGALDGFGWAVTREDALRALDHFIGNRLPFFGDYQDAMRRGEDFVFHAALSPYLNCGLLTAREVCNRAEAAYEAGEAPLNAVEGFIRQILGWREYVRGIYWTQMPGYKDGNRLGAKRRLPDFYWSGKTDMVCLAESIRNTRDNAYAHHIQRLMVTGNFALLAGVDPKEIEDWYLLVYADAYEWVELPNVHGMVMFADGGLLASKPYAASGAYIHRMSDYCGSCRYDPNLKTGEAACPFNPLYWNFLIENEVALKGNPRMAMPYKTLERMTQDRRAEIRTDADAVFKRLGLN